MILFDDDALSSSPRPPDPINAWLRSNSTPIAVPLGSQPDSPVIIQLPQRAWGAAAHLTEEAVKAAIGETAGGGVHDLRCRHSGGTE